MRTQRSDGVLAEKLNAYFPLTSDEHDCLAKIQSGPLTVKRGKRLTQEGQSDHKVFVLHAGWVCSYKDLFDGQRQIISLAMAGDCIGLRSALLRTADHSCSTLTGAVVSSVEGARILQCITEFPRLGPALHWAASKEVAMVVERLVSVGRRNAVERTAHFFMELAERLNLIGVGAEPTFRCPLTQSVLADALGLTAIHVNRVLRELREQDILTLHKGTVTIHDLKRLRNVAGFVADYLR